MGGLTWVKRDQAQGLTSFWKKSNPPPFTAHIFHPPFWHLLLQISGITELSGDFEEIVEIKLPTYLLSLACETTQPKSRQLKNSSSRGPAFFSFINILMFGGNWKMSGPIICKQSVLFKHVQWGGREWLFQYFSGSAIALAAFRTWQIKLNLLNHIYVSGTKWIKKSLKKINFPFEIKQLKSTNGRLEKESWNKYSETKIKEQKEQNIFLSQSKHLELDKENLQILRIDKRQRKLAKIIQECFWKMSGLITQHKWIKIR